MKQALLQTFVRTVVPPLLGAAGALMATAFPAYYAAVCTSSLALPGVY